jgi:hypothetical protein
VRSRGGSWLGCQGFLGRDVGSRDVSRGGFQGWISGMGFGDAIWGAASGLSRVLTLFFFFSVGPWDVHRRRQRTQFDFSVATTEKRWTSPFVCWSGSVSLKMVLRWKGLFWTSSSGTVPSEPTTTSAASTTSLTTGFPRISRYNSTLRGALGTQ